MSFGSSSGTEWSQLSRPGSLPMRSSCTLPCCADKQWCLANRLYWLLCADAIGSQGENEWYALISTLRLAPLRWSQERSSDSCSSSSGDGAIGPGRGPSLSVLDDLTGDPHGPWRVCCRCPERIGDPDDDGSDEHGGICSLGMVFERCWTCEGLCHVHGVLNGPECRGLRCRAVDGEGGPPPGPCLACGTSPPCRTCMAASAYATWTTRPAICASALHSLHKRTRCSNAATSLFYPPSSILNSLFS